MCGRERAVLINVVIWTRFCHERGMSVGLVETQIMRGDSSVGWIRLASSKETVKPHGAFSLFG